MWDYSDSVKQIWPDWLIDIDSDSHIELSPTGESILITTGYIFAVVMYN